MKRDYTKIDNINTSLRFKSTGFFSSWFNEEGQLIIVFFSNPACIQLFQKRCRKKSKTFKPRPKGNMGFL